MTVALDRDQIVRRFEELLDHALAAEGPPSGVDAEILSAVTEGEHGGDQQTGSYALWSAMTALTQEIKLQGRAFQELNLTLSSQPGKIADELRAVYTEREKALQREADRRSRKEILGALLDLRDRLGRGHETVRASGFVNTAPSPVAFWERIKGKPVIDPASIDAVAALVRGYELGIERLEQTLGDFNAREIRSHGEMFDPKRMNAIDSEETSDVPPGTVLEVFRSGYEWNGEVFRPAQVKVARPPGGTKEQS
jgi:molecular chaperone GrpE